MEKQNKMLKEQNFVNDVRSIIEQGRKMAYAAAGQAAITTYWNVGRRIVEEEQAGKVRAEYGKNLMKNLADDLVPSYGNSYSKRNLDYYKKFYLLFPDIQIVNARVHNLEWTHVRRILSVTNSKARLWYLTVASENMWSTRELDRNISTQYYERRLAAQSPANVEDLPKDKNKDPMEYIKNPFVAEFMGFKRGTSATHCYGHRRLLY